MRTLLFVGRFRLPDEHIDTVQQAIGAGGFDENVISQKERLDLSARTKNVPAGTLVCVGQDPAYTEELIGQVLDFMGDIYLLENWHSFDKRPLVIWVVEKDGTMRRIPIRC